MAAQAAAAAQHAPSVNNNKHANSEGAYDYAEKRQKMDDSPQGQLPSPLSPYPYPNAYERAVGQRQAIHGLPA